MTAYKIDFINYDIIIEISNVVTTVMPTCCLSNELKAKTAKNRDIFFLIFSSKTTKKIKLILKYPNWQFNILLALLTYIDHHNK